VAKGLSPDGKVVYMADCMLRRLYAFDLKAPGVMTTAEIPNDPTAQGRVIATLFNGGITTFQPDGRYGHVPMPDPVTTTLCFGGADLRDVRITGSSSGRLYRMRWPRPGLKMAHPA